MSEFLSASSNGTGLNAPTQVSEQLRLDSLQHGSTPGESSLDEVAAGQIAPPEVVEEEA